MPGVPPNTIDNLKRAFKGIFKRGKKKEQSQVAETPSNSTADQSSSARPAAAAGANPPNTDKPLPLTHPLTTDEHKQPQEAVPQNHAAKPGPAAADVSGVKESMSDRADVSPASVSAEGRSDTVSALENENPPQTPPKSDAAAARDTASTVAKPTEAAATDATTGHSTATAPKLDPALPTQTPDTATKATQETVVQEQTNKHDPLRPTSADEKIVAAEEPPPIKAVKAAPGMSATSGPLEDFPEGGDLEP